MSDEWIGLKFVEDRAQGVDDLQVSLFRIAANVVGLAGAAARERFDTGLKKTVEWYLDHMQWVDDVTSGDYRKWVDLNYGKRERA